jgi:hypothetical protein
MKKYQTILIYILFALLLAACQGANDANAPTLLAPDPTPVDSLPNEADLRPPLATNFLGLRIEEHELIQRPDVEPLSFTPVTGSFSEILGKNTEERGQSIAGGKIVQLQNGQWIRAEETSQETGLPDPVHVINIAISQNENKILEMQTPVSPIPALRGLWAIGDDWFAEIAVPPKDSFRLFAKGDIFKNGMSLNEMYSYSESFGFQQLGGKPFYFFERFGRVGISYGGQEIPLGYERVIHYECCSAGELNPRTFENMVGFFATRGDKWHYVEISGGQGDASSPTPFSIPFSQFEDGGWRYLRDEQGLAYWHFPELPGIIFRNNGIRYEKTPSPAHMAPLPPIVTIGLYVEIYPHPESQIDTIRCGTSPFLASIHNEICTHFFRDIVVFSPGGAPLETKPCGGGGGQDGFLEKDGFLATSEGLAVCLKAEDELPFARQEQGEILDWPIELQTSEDLGLEGPIRLWVPLYYQTELGG